MLISESAIDQFKCTELECSYSAKYNAITLHNEGVRIDTVCTSK